jgi:hypothetical protein
VIGEPLVVGEHVQEREHLLARAVDLDGDADRLHGEHPLGVCDIVSHAMEIVEATTLLAVRRFRELTART